MHTVAALCFGKGAFSPCPEYCLFMSTTCAQCVQHVQVVHHLCTVSTDYTQVNVYVCSVHKLCRVCTNYAQCPRVCTVSTGCTRGNRPVQPFLRWALCTPILNIVSLCLQHVQLSHHLCRVSTDYTRVNVYVHSVYKLCRVSTDYVHCFHVCTVSTYCTQVNGPMQLFLRGALCTPPLVLSLCVCNMCTVSTTCARCTPSMQSVYRLNVHIPTYTRIHVYAYTCVYVQICCFLACFSPYPPSRRSKYVHDSSVFVPLFPYPSALLFHNAACPSAPGKAGGTETGQRRGAPDTQPGARSLPLALRPLLLLLPPLPPHCLIHRAARSQ